MTNKDTIPGRGRRLVTAVGIAAALLLGMAGFAQPTIASAKGISWDTYSDCLNKSKANDPNVKVELCCIEAGGTVVADRDTGKVHCWSSEPTPEECKTMIGPNCTRQVPPGMDPAVPTIDNPPVSPGLRTRPPVDLMPVQLDDPSVSQS